MTLQCVTSDQQRYIRVYEIVSSMKINFFFRLGGFHQMVSFLGFIGSLMEGSGLTSALETVYAPATVGHMFSGKTVLLPFMVIFNQHLRYPRLCLKNS